MHYNMLYPIMKLKPILSITISKKLHSTLSYALLISNFNATIPSFPSPLLFVAWNLESYQYIVCNKTFRHKITLISRNNRPQHRFQFVSKLRVLKMILYKMLHKLIGRNSVILLGSLFFGIKTIQVVLPQISQSHHAIKLERTGLNHSQPCSKLLKK